MAVRVTFDVREPGTHLVAVTMRFPASPSDRRSFRMPAWVPGSYRIRDYGRHVEAMEARVGGRPAQHEQVGKDEWVVLGCAGRAVELRFRVYARELGVQGSHVTAGHAHLFPATLTMYDAASRGQVHTVRVLRPQGWTLWSGLEDGALAGSLAPAASFDHLIDCPIECGPPAEYHTLRFVLRGRTHRAVFWHPPPGVDWRRIQHDMAAVVRTTLAFWGKAPYAHYTFLAHVAPEHGGGLEHRNSTVLGVDPTHLLADDRIQGNFLPLVCHEFFHTWNVKRILPAAFQPYDLQHESYTDLLWLFEGFTSYYELPLLHRAAVVDTEAWARHAAEMLESYEKAVGRRHVSVAHASRLAWTLLYQPHEHNINRNVSYYTKGLFVGLCLDAHLRRKGVRDGLDAVMRHLWRKHGQTGMGVTEDAMADVVLQATGHDCRRRLARWVDGTDELPVDAAFRTLGWGVERGWKDPKRKTGLGIQFRAGTATIERIPADAPSYLVLQPDDEMVAVDGHKWRSDRFGEWVAARKAGATVDLAVFREGRLLHLEVPLSPLPQDKVSITHLKGAAATRARKAWLGKGRPSKAKGAAAPTVPRRKVRY